MENEPFEHVIPIETGDIPASYVSLLEGIGYHHAKHAPAMTISIRRIAPVAVENLHHPTTSSTFQRRFTLVFPKLT